MGKFLDSIGVNTLWNKIKDKFALKSSVPTKLSQLINDIPSNKKLCDILVISANGNTHRYHRVARALFNNTHDSSNNVYLLSCPKGECGIFMIRNSTVATPSARDDDEIIWLVRTSRIPADIIEVGVYDEELPSVYDLYIKDWQGLADELKMSYVNLYLIELFQDTNKYTYFKSKSGAQVLPENIIESYTSIEDAQEKLDITYNRVIQSTNDVANANSETIEYLQGIVNKFQAFLESTDAKDTTINRWKELESFLDSITDTQTLTGVIQDAIGNIPLATWVKNGLMDKDDKTYLDGIKVHLNTGYVVDNFDRDVEYFNNNIQIPTKCAVSELTDGDPGNIMDELNSITLDAATSTTAGVMSADDKKHLDNTIVDKQFINPTILSMTGKEEANPNWCSTDFIPLDKTKSVIIVGASGTTVGNICFYDANKKFISAVSANSEVRIQFDVTPANIPTNAAYFKACCNNFGLRLAINGSINDSMGTFITELASHINGDIANVVLKHHLNNYFNLNNNNSIKASNTFEKINNFKNTQRFYSSIELANSSAAIPENGTVFRIQYSDYNGTNNDFRGSEVLDMKYENNNAILHFTHGSGNLHTNDHFIQAGGFKVNGGVGHYLLLDSGSRALVSSIKTQVSVVADDILNSSWFTNIFELMSNNKLLPNIYYKDNKITGNRYLATPWCNLATNDVGIIVNTGLQIFNIYYDSEDGTIKKTIRNLVYTDETTTTLG